MPQRLAQVTRLTRWVNYLGVPALVVPCGFDSRGLPIGLQLGARPFAEGTLLAAGHRFQQRDYAQAESTALRSESWAGKDNLLRADNWRLIAAARDARGDTTGAQQAREAAGRFER
jgi:hypothetical protein